MLLVAVHLVAIGTQQTKTDVRYAVANGVKADKARIAKIDANDPKQT